MTVEQITMDSRMKIAVLSDLHAFEDLVNGRRPSLLRVSDAESNAEMHPITGLRMLIQTHRIKADLLLCGGDLGDRAARVGIKYAWEKVHLVKKWLKCRLVVGTAGNHDLDSRLVNNEYGPREYLQSLKPKFPVTSAGTSDKYWANHYAFIIKDFYRILLLNSSRTTEQLITRRTTEGSQRRLWLR